MPGPGTRDAKIGWTLWGMLPQEAEPRPLTLGLVKN
jgi:hypothetical protein